MRASISRQRRSARRADARCRPLLCAFPAKRGRRRLPLKFDRQVGGTSAFERQGTTDEPAGIAHSVKPPSTTAEVPVVNLDSSEAR